MWLPSRHINKYSATLSHCLKRLQLPCSPALFKTSKFLGPVLNLFFQPRINPPPPIVEAHSVWERTQVGKRGTKRQTLSPSSFYPLLDAWSSPWEMHIWEHSTIAVWALTPSGDLCTLPPPPCFLFGGEEFLITPVAGVVHGGEQEWSWGMGTDQVGCAPRSRSLTHHCRPPLLSFIRQNRVANE